MNYSYAAPQFLSLLVEVFSVIGGLYMLSKVALSLLDSCCPGQPSTTALPQEADEDPQFKSTELF